MKGVNTDVAYAYVRKMILAGSFAPGATLKIDEISKATKISRTPIRDALRQLEAEGLVLIRPRMGSLVKKVDVKEFKELCVVRSALESCAASLAAEHGSEGDFEQIAQAFESMQVLVQGRAGKDSNAESHNKLLKEDVRFHYAIVKAAKNETLMNEILRIQAIDRIMIRPLLKPLKSEQSRSDDRKDREKVLENHRRILKAIQRRDADAARKEMQNHIMDISNKLMRESDLEMDTKLARALESIV